ncbi:MAG: sulfite oxidase [Chloroflexi bacterium]|nr:sulfite oxidase [Chloroflexota bacterium]
MREGDLTQSYAPPFPGKSPELIPLGDGLNFSTPLARAMQNGGTRVPTDLFFLRSNNPVPQVDPTEWRLRIEGRVREPLTVGVSELQSLPSTAQETWLECAGNSRTRWNPPAEGNQWDDQAISNAMFTGVPLRTLLERAGVESDAVEVITTGADADQHAEGGRFQRGLPIDVALQPQVMLVWQMNGEPIPTANGGPVRLIVPGWAGIASVKWPVRMEVVSEPFGGYYNAQRYIVVDPEGRTLRTVREMPVKSVFAWPGRAEVIRGESVTLFGFGWSGRAPIERVDVSVDGQRTWQPASLVRGEGRWSWTRWEFAWRPTSSGRAQLSVRATDTAGNVQPASVPWNKFGYGLNAIMTREVTVQL